MSVSTLPPPEVLVNRDEPLADLKAVLAAVRRDENARKWMAATAVAVPWLIAVTAAGFAVYCGVSLFARPPPKDHFVIATVHADNSYDPPVERTGLSPDKRKVLLDYSINKFVLAWENYAWRANNGNYKFISAVTVGEDLQHQYQRRFAEDNPTNLDKTYGPTTTRDVLAMYHTQVPGSPQAFDVRMLVKLRKAGETACQRWTARLTFRDDDKGIVPMDIQTLYNPMDIIFVSYDSSPDPTAPGIAPCPGGTS